MNTGPIIAPQFLHHVGCITVKGSMIDKTERGSSHIRKCTGIRLIVHMTDSQKPQQGIDRAQGDELIWQADRSIPEGEP